MGIKLKYSSSSSDTNLAYFSVDPNSIYKIYNTLRENKLTQGTLNYGKLYSGRIYNNNTIVLPASGQSLPYVLSIYSEYDERARRESLRHGKQFLKITKYVDSVEQGTYLNILDKNIIIPYIPSENTSLKFNLYGSLINDAYINVQIYFTDLPYNTIFTDKFDDKIYLYSYITNQTVDINDSSIILKDKQNNVISPDSYYSTVLTYAKFNYIILYFDINFYEKYKEKQLFMYYNAIINGKKIYNYSENLAFYPVGIAGYRPFYFHKTLVGTRSYSNIIYYKYPDIKLNVTNNDIKRFHYITVSKGYNSETQLNTTTLNDTKPLNVFYQSTSLKDYSYKKIRKESSIISNTYILTNKECLSLKEYNIYDTFLEDTFIPDGYPIIPEFNYGINIYFNNNIFNNKYIKSIKKNMIDVNRLTYNYETIQTTYITKNDYIEVGNNINPFYNSNLHNTTYYVYLSGINIISSTTFVSGISLIGYIEIAKKADVMFDYVQVEKRGGGLSTTDIPVDMYTYTDLDSWEKYAHQRNFIYISGISGVMTYDDFYKLYHEEE